MDELNDKKELQIVVVDDSDYSRKSIINVLESQGFKVVGEAESAEKAATIIRTVKSNLFLIDIVMPEASGLELAKLVQEELKECKIIMMSSLKMEDIIIESISNGAIDYLEKPFSPEDLLKSVRKVEVELERI
jgi:two-component system chemotaxis response regulator CheY